MKYCSFCQGPLIYRRIEVLLDNGCEAFCCHSCDTAFIYWIAPNKSIDDLAAYCIYTEVNSKRYRWSKTSSGGEICYIEKSVPMMEEMNHMRFVHVLLSFDDKQGTPNINPTNIKEKIKTLITFS